MATTSVFRITHPETAAQLSGFGGGSGSTEPINAINGLIQYLRAVARGLNTASINVRPGQTLVAASGTATFVSIVQDDVVTINGVAFTCRDADPTGNQFLKGASDTTAAAACAAAINASTTAKISGYVTATSSAGVVTITARQPGVAGNMFTLAKTGAPITVTGSGFLTAGTGDNVAGTTYNLA
jgi:phage tail sheath gpL-like